MLALYPISRFTHPVPAAGPVQAVAPVIPARLIMTQDQLKPMVAQAGSKYHVDKDLIASLLKVESGGDARAVSPTGAEGLMQLMPQTATEMGVTNSFVPAQSISGGAAYIGRLLKHYHNRITLAVAAYNAGPHAVDHYQGTPPFRETRSYVHRVLAELHRRKHAGQILASSLHRHRSSAQV